MKKSEKKTKISETTKDSETMLAQKTYEDFNKEKPLSSDFKKKKRGTTPKSAVDNSSIK